MTTKLEAQLARNGLAPDHAPLRHKVEKSYATHIARLTDQNQHWDAAASIAARYGTAVEARAIDTFHARANARGFSEPSEIHCRTTMLAAILERLPADQAALLREAL